MPTRAGVKGRLRVVEKVNDGREPDEKDEADMTPEEKRQAALRKVHDNPMFVRG